MALSSISVLGADHFAKGGVKYMTIDTVANSSGMSDSDGAGAVTMSSAVTVYFEKESASMTISNTQSNALTTHEISIEGYIPDITKTKLQQLQELQTEPLIAQVHTWDGVNYLVGWDSVTATDAGNTDFPLLLQTVEANTGSGLSDQNGVTLTFSCTAGRTPATIA
jgi:hypothetical protein